MKDLVEKFIVLQIQTASCTDNIHDLENEKWLLGDMIDHVGIYGSRVAEGLSAFNVGLVNMMTSSNGIICRVTGHLCGKLSSVNSPHKG